MTRKAVAWLVAFGLVGPAGARQAVDTQRGDLPDNMEEFRQTPQTDDSPVTPEAPEEEAGVGGSGTAGTGQERRGELSGEVVRVQGDQLWLRHAGAVFPLALTEQTRFTPNRQRALQPGQEVRARFTLGQEGYVVNALEPLEGTAAQRPPGQKQETQREEAPER